MPSASNESESHGVRDTRERETVVSGYRDGGRAAGQLMVRSNYQEKYSFRQMTLWVNTAL